MTGILLVNLGTPSAPTTKAVRRYLKQFLSDPRVIDINPILRFGLVRFLILPFRSPRSARQYQKVWTAEGSPLLCRTEALRKAVAENLGEDYVVEIGMRYGTPSIESGLKKLMEKKVSCLKVLPLFPQQASSSTGSAIEEFFRVAGRLRQIPPVQILPPFYDCEGFLDSFAEIGRPLVEKARPDHILFSFHGLPERHIAKGDPYQMQALFTARAIARRLGLAEGSYSVTFQSRLGRTPWIRPYTDRTLLDLVRQGKKRFLVFCPSFVADCLETLEEIAIRNREAVLAAGGEEVILVPSLNTHPRWVETVCDLVR
ncbi:MAG: ferrochelatase [Deltaproteobacteria bacterium]|nr:ferrochelatase [Deltaproteobacteria bacterium]